MENTEAPVRIGKASRPKHEQHIWDEASDAMLRKLRDEDLTFAQIGARMGLNKSQIIGRAHRLKLPAHQSVRRQGRPKYNADGSLRLPKPPRPPREKKTKPEPIRETPRHPVQTQTFYSEPIPAIPRRQAVVVRDCVRPGPPCKWPLWGFHDAVSHKFCCEPSVPGFSYCMEHAAIAYVFPKFIPQESPAPGA